MHLSPVAKDAAISLLDTAGAQHSGDGLRDAGKDRWVRKDEGPGTLRFRALLIGEEYGT
jgi:hypothetical protein